MGKFGNRGNLKRTAHQCGIEGCFQLTVEEILMRLKVCIKRCDYFRKNGGQYRRKHLADCLAQARDREDSKGEREILVVIQWERDWSFWRRLNYIMRKARSGSI
jgi:hypothetical protein